MPTRLTRRVLRRILANQPIAHAECQAPAVRHAPRAYTVLTHRARQRPQSWAHQSRLAATSTSQQRSFFDLNLFAPKKRQIKDADLEPGMEEMMHLAKMQRMNARLPPVETIREALDDYFRKTKGSISDRSAKYILNSFQYCWAAEDADPPSGSSFKVLLQVARRLYKPQTSVSEHHLKLASLVYERTRQASLPLRAVASIVYPKLLATTGQVADALRTLEQAEAAERRRGKLNSSIAENGREGDYEEAAEEGVHSEAVTYLSTAWVEVMRRVARREDEQALLHVMALITAKEWLNVPPHRLAEPMLWFYVRTSNREAVQMWWTQYWDNKPEPGLTRPRDSTAAVAENFSMVLRWCLAHKQLQFGHQVVRQAMQDNPPKLMWDAIFIWAAGTGKGADEIGRMLDVMQKSNDDLNPEEWRLPDGATINGLVEYATFMQDPYLAERFIALGQARNIQPDARTYQLQMQYRLKIKDVDGALIAYKNLQTMDLSANEDVPTVNELIVALCQSKRHDFDTVMNVAMDLADRRVRFEPPTVTALALLHLNRDEMHDVIDLLNTHAHHYSTIDRDNIRATILNFCLDPANPTSRAWDAYKILGTVFDEMPRADRTRAMTSFFSRQRPDMAVFIFNEMRRHSRADTIPTIDTYVASFLGSAKLKDVESLELIHNQLKLDYNITANTYLLNSMMIAYTACGRPRQALAFWNDIVASREGPTYNSIHIALRACEKAPFGDLRAKELWAKLKQMNVDLDQTMWASYVGALAGNGDIAMALQVVEDAESKNEVEVDAFLLGSVFDAAARHAEKQDEVEMWARDRYPQVWDELEKIGFEVNEESKKNLPKIDRSVTP